MGFTGFYRVEPGCEAHRYDWVLVSRRMSPSTGSVWFYDGFCKVSLVFTGFYRVLLRFTELYLDFTGFYLI